MRRSRRAASLRINSHAVRLMRPLECFLNHRFYHLSLLYKFPVDFLLVDCISVFFMHLLSLGVSCAGVREIRAPLTSFHILSEMFFHTPRAIRAYRIKKIMASNEWVRTLMSYFIDSRFFVHTVGYQSVSYFLNYCVTTFWYSFFKIS